jgi:ribosomal protein S18 acetylase RimI-like enzyme
MAVDVDEELARSYLIGPLIEHPRWREIALRLVQECLGLVPENATKQLEMFFDLGNSNVAELGRALGFETYKDVRVLRFQRRDLGAVGRGAALPFASEHHDAVIALHGELFPNTHLPGARMVAGLGDTKACFVRLDEDEVVGYIYMEVDEDTGSASIEFVGTSEAARGRGIGADLVRTGLHWMFGFDSVSETWLVVDEDNAGAQHLYRSLGWTEVHRFTSLRRSGRPSPASSARNRNPLPNL